MTRDTYRVQIPELASHVLATMARFRSLLSIALDRDYPQLAGDG